MVKLYNVEVWNKHSLAITYYMNAPYAVCVDKKKKLITQGVFERSIHIVQVKKGGIK
jgi:hypothetical protein